MAIMAKTYLADEAPSRLEATVAYLSQPLKWPWCQLPYDGKLENMDFPFLDLNFERSRASRGARTRFHDILSYLLDRLMLLE
jgi:hypothetical protein